MAISVAITQIVNVLYNIVDRMYIGHILEVVTKALTGVGICFPILMLVSAFSSFIGGGGTLLAAIELGKGNRKEAEKVLGNSSILLCFISITLMTFLCFTKPLFSMLLEQVMKPFLMPLII
ncbi:MATE family efflux transporter [Cellulosilyticum ruminicola]|uniref:MATE family efflux transporter n=1 Tax=Cellulosilyticum ruminicola TaxID=425254 RepID=UPI000B00D77A|nr:MATE family efflux transporter [Cellulosilyticum ruminicola]